MWLPLTLLVLAGIVSADYDHGWKAGHEYTYLVRSRTFTSLNQLSDQYTGILIKARLTIQAQDSNKLIGQVSKPQYARIHKSLPEGWETRISDQKLELRDLPSSGKPFEIHLKRGVIRDVIVDRDVPTWEVNLLKSIVSQLQVDSQGENAKQSNEIQAPSDEDPYGSFRSMEDSVGGECEVLYDITPLAEEDLHQEPELAPMPKLVENGQFIQITKTKNFDRCNQRMNYHFGISGSTDWEPGSNDNGNFLSKSATSRIVISGNLRQFTIQSSVTTNKMHVSPRFFDQQNGMVVSRMNLTLANMGKISNQLPSPSNPESTGNLVYTYGNPFADFNDRRSSSKKGQNSSSNRWKQSDSISSVSSSEEANRNNRQHGGMPPPGFSASSSSSSSSSSYSSSEENDFWQPKPNLEDAPRNPFLPNFIGYYGKYIGGSDKVDVVQASKELVAEISNELEDPSNIPGQQTLEKFTILCGVIRTMNRQQIGQVDSHVHASPNDLKSNDNSQAIKQNAWAVFRDAVTQAGTGPALLTIKNWVEKKNIEQMEAADILSRLSKNARTPTDEYVRTFFELATNPKVANEPILGTSAIFAFAELLRYSRVNSGSIHNRYPVHTYGRMVSKHDRSLEDEYIPYMAKELSKAIKDQNSQKIQTYVMALGNVGHPKILSVFEPYIEGKELVTDFQRSLMVAALGKLAENYPKLTRSVLYKIYLNTMENHEVRCVAVFLLMKTNPPLSMLQRMAEFTNYDTDKHVNSAVKSTLMSLAKLSDPQNQDLAKKCQAAVSLLTPEEYNYQFSHGYFDDTVDHEKNIVSQLVFNYIGSDDSAIPRALYLAMYSSYGNFHVPPTELITMVSSVKNIFDMINENEQSYHRGSPRSAAEKIAEQLNIIAQPEDPFEGNVMWKSKFQSRFIPFDRQTFKDIPTFLAKTLLNTKDGSYVNLHRFQSYDVTLGFPLESGLPFVYTFRVPILYKFSGSGQIQINKGPEFTVKSNIRAVFSQKIQGRIGFVAPFEHHYFVAGVDVNYQAYTPVKFSLEGNVPKGKFRLNLWPLKGEEKANLFHYSVFPYTSAHDILSLRPLATDKNTQQVYYDEVQTTNLPSGDRFFKINVEGDKSDKDFWNFDLDNFGEEITNPFTMDNDKYRKINVYLNLDHQQSQPIQLTAFYDYKNMEPNSGASQEWSSEAKAIDPSSKGPDGESRRKQYLEEAGKGIKSAKSQVVDVHLELPNEPKSHVGATLAWASSDMDSKDRANLYMYFDMPSRQAKYEVCAAAQSRTSPDSLAYFEQASKTKPKGEFDVDVRYGKSCSQGEQINVQGKASQSNEFAQYVQNTPVAKECRKQMEHGNKILSACRYAAAMAMSFDRMEISMGAQSRHVQELVDMALGAVGSSNYVNAHIDASNPKNAGKQKVDFKAKLHSDMETAHLAVHTPSMDFHLKNVDLNSLGYFTEPFLYTGDSSFDPSNLEASKDESACTLDKTRAETFDGKQYPLRLGNCWHVVMTTYPKQNPEDKHQSLSIPKDSRVSILTKETQNGEKNVKILLGDDEIHFQPTSSYPEVTVNGKTVQVSHGQNYQERQNDEVAYEIYRENDKFVGLTSDKYDINIAFDGQRLIVRPSDKYRNSVRGICGDYDNDLSNEFVGPTNCLYRKPEHFTASYALTKDQCEGEALNHAQTSRNCQPRRFNRFSNVINNHNDYNRDNRQQNSWGYNKGGQASQSGSKRCSTHRTHILETDEQICFSKRPVLACAPGCSPTENKSKNYQFYCMERNEAAQNLKNRIEKGANPDLSQKPVSMNRNIDVPLACKG